MPGIVEQCAKALSEVYGFYRQKACPCAFPRFAQLVGFDFRRYGTSPVGCHPADILLDLAMNQSSGNLQPVGEWDGNERRFACSRCASEGVMYSEQFNIQMTASTFTFSTIKALPLGAAALDRICIPKGFYAFSDNAIAACSSFYSESTVPQMVDYLKALNSTTMPERISL